MSAGTTQAQAHELTAPSRTTGRGRAIRWFAGLALLVGVAAVAVVVSNPFAASKVSGRVRDNGAGTSLVAVTRAWLASQTEVSGTLGYAGTYTIINNASGTATWLPSQGQVIGRGQV